MRRRYPDMEMSARRIIAKFRDGDFGRLNLDAEKMDRAQKKRDNQGKQKVVDLFEVDNSLVK